MDIELIGAGGEIHPDCRPSFLTTTAIETHQCEVSITLNETHLIITTNGLPNHDFESTLACSQAGDCATAQSYTWSIPRSPVNDTTGGHDSTNCPEANGDKECAPDSELTNTS